MGLLFPETIDRTMFGTQNEATFMFELRAKSKWVNSIQADEIGGGLIAIIGMRPHA